MKFHINFKNLAEPFEVVLNKESGIKLLKDYFETGKGGHQLVYSYNQEDNLPVLLRLDEVVAIRQVG